MSIVAGPLAHPAGRWGLALALLTLHLAVALGAASGLARDDLETVFFAQGWAWGYDPEQPPLYNWLTQALTDLVGPSLGAAVGLRWAIIAAGLVALFDAVRRMAGGDRALAAGAVAGAAGTALFGYEGALHFTHTTLLISATAAVLWAIARIAERPTSARYLALGAALAVACLSKYTFAVFGLALVAAALTDPLLRARVLDRRVLWAALPSLPLLPGHLWWRMGQDMVLSDRVASITSQGREVPLPLWERLPGLATDVIVDPVMGMAPPLVLIALLVGVAPRARASRGATPETGTPRWPRVLLVFVLASMALTLAVVLATGGHRLRYHYMMPAALVLPAAALLGARAWTVSLAPWRARALGWSLAGLAVLAAGGVAADRLIREPVSCGRCLSLLPVEAAAARVRAAGFDGRGTIIAASLDWGANLRRAFPDARLLARSFPDWRPPADDPGDGACLILLSRAEAEALATGAGLDGAALAEAVAPLVDGAPDALPLPLARARVADLPLTRAPLSGGARRTVPFGFLLVPKDRGTCR
ncbi:glycosyltransferase family 39 protein [Roseospira visakhapatnamensis]|uniref:Glycosyltransferase RgtA/B/C/D-like domain-containing protein n=1 Tax=Roseospira visakhapatnamensis TaxID=390880 RepID=A0A7W6RET1_9PROT|nr:glycosyltransferase family 39 protein [Roseospira visakhapatnamensis]MBB4267221.1 hypothetical protein [Roseospira visakhapatnamensis]